MGKSWRLNKMKCKDCNSLAIDISIYDKPWCLANNEDVLNIEQECQLTKEAD